MPGETQTLKWVPDQVGVVPMYCTDFCSALHQEMQGYVRVAPRGTTVAVTATTSKKAQSQIARLHAVEGGAHK
jgi:nitrous-oxide reductase